ncbi:hypothetical protein NQZ68_021771 [Dissostichus eleginoides]|nr:hypothetical protein NQZ68_021771 [Dissostichus eleginoides]
MTVTLALSPSSTCILGEGGSRGQGEHEELPTCPGSASCCTASTQPADGWSSPDSSSAVSSQHLALRQRRERESLSPQPILSSRNIRRNNVFFVRETGEGLELGRPMTRSLCTDTIKQTQQPRVFLLVTEMQRRQLTHCLVYGGGSRSGLYLQLCAGS